MLLVALTGGIGSGKSTVARLLAERGAGRRCRRGRPWRSSSPAARRSRRSSSASATGILLADGSLDRPALARTRLRDEETPPALEAITHPAIVEEFCRRIDAAPTDAVVVLRRPAAREVEARLRREYAAVIVVEAPREVRLDRLVERGLARDDASGEWPLQADDDERRAVATARVDNGGDLAALERQVDAIWAEPANGSGPRAGARDRT